MWSRLVFVAGLTVAPRTVALVERLARQAEDRAKANEVRVYRIRSADEEPYRRRYRKQRPLRRDRGG